MTELPEPAEAPPALGVVLDADRGSLPYALVHGEALVACAAWALGEAGVLPLDLGTPWSVVQEAEEPLVLHDALCPMTPPGYLAECVARAVAGDTVVVGVRPVTDTVKHVEGEQVGATVDRAGLLALASPVVLPASVVAALPGWPGTDLVAVVGELATRFPVASVEAPASARRVADLDDLAVLEALTSPGG
ncbi:2-C-methyl-D-erythritol 4-phosphate cytidylyltransferase [Nocardioides pantholopis]|uniref:2-C-methyl-D-erythritol 4-phosphate cytidylyltransferase n=1 Tax=Nocardioides pantholopis TaxID=2483798 RepID=UPI000F075D09|nr:2-C-methyl-D-erythritol 4-phosphate cytidylyltransferase [Nocardioides pantholopis]